MRDERAGTPRRGLSRRYQWVRAPVRLVSAHRRCRRSLSPGRDHAHPRSEPRLLRSLCNSLPRTWQAPRRVGLVSELGSCEGEPLRAAGGHSGQDPQAVLGMRFGRVQLNRHQARQAHGPAELRRGVGLAIRPLFSAHHQIRSGQARARSFSVTSARHTRFWLQVYRGTAPSRARVAAWFPSLPMKP
jgi:hypothetical protein